MNKKIYLLVLACFAYLQASSQWQPVGDKIKTEWAKEVNPNKVHNEYPRPIMQRSDWMNLNGLWNYQIVKRGEEASRTNDGQILVPFAIESSLSGVGKRLNSDEELIYQRSFTIPSSWTKKRILLHFGAVDWKTDVWVNGIKVGEHTGGYTPFTFDITQALEGKGKQELMVRVWDPTDKGYQPRGKQVSKPEGIWYTPVSGIWQTVWLEPVSEDAIEQLRILPDIDKNVLTVNTGVAMNKKVEITVYDAQHRKVALGMSINGQPVEIRMPKGYQLWSPSNPYLYDLDIKVYQGKQLIDQVKSYAAMRKFSTKRDQYGIVRLQLNNEPLFQFGPLDQGWWPDGLYTAPTDEALYYDIKKTKDFGFNMIRKHIKVEPARWYTYCDQLGIIVWQDMPSGDRGPEWQNRQYFNGTEAHRSLISEANYRKEWREIIDCLYSYPCIGTWVPFNEAWGQFKSPEIAEWTKEYDPSRLVNPASGGNHYLCGDILDLHNYPAPDLYLYDAQRATVLGEYGGIGLVLKDHLWEPNHNWGYVQFASSKEATDEYVKYANQLLELIDKGFSAAVYTQTTDVEMEVNGLMTYDRKVIKLDEQRVKEINTRICNALNKLKQ